MNKAFILGVAVCLTLPLFACAKKTSVVTNSHLAREKLPPEISKKFDKNNDNIIDRADWKRMKNSEKKTYARMSLEAIGENPDAMVTEGKTRADLVLEGLESVYGKR